MKKFKKSFIEKAVIMPAAIAVLAVIAFFAAGSSAQDGFNSHKTVLAEFDAENPVCEYEFGTASNYSYDELNKSEIKEFYKKNYAVGTMSFKNTELSLVYDADEALLGTEDAASVIENGKLIGEVGSAYIYGYKSGLSELDKLQIGDEITVKLPYGDYKFRVINSEAVVGENSVLLKNPDASRALVIYTEKDNGAGISNEYVTVTAEMIDGTAVEGQVH